MKFTSQPISRPATSPEMAAMSAMEPHRSMSTISVDNPEDSGPPTPYAELTDDAADDGLHMHQEDSEAARRLLAISALDTMKTGSAPLYGPYQASTPSSTSASVTTTSSQYTSPATSLADINAPLLSDPPDLVDEHFLNRVSQMPLVSGALKGYERARNSNRVVRYGADLVESGVNGVRKISTPVIGRVIGPEQLGQLEDFANRQLDKLGGNPATSTRPLTPAEEVILAEKIAALEQTHPADGDEGLRLRKGKGKAVAQDMCDSPEASSSSASMTTTTQLAPRSRWQSLIVEAGGLGAAVSEESMKSMQYCLEWLHYASAHLDHEIIILRDFIASLGSSANTEGALVHPSEATQTLARIKRDVVETIRKVVDVVSRYAGAALPEHAKRFVRQSILSLPAKWTQSIQQRPPTGADVASPPTTLQGQTKEAAERVLSFAVESLDMLSGVTHIFGESVERAEAWLERLRVVGMAQQQRRRLEKDPAASDAMDEDERRARPRPRLEKSYDATMQVEA